MFAIEHYLLIALYFILLALVLVNIWQVIIKLRKYKYLPLLMFYIFAFMAIFFRLLVLIWEYTVNPKFYYNVSDL